MNAAASHDHPERPAVPAGMLGRFVQQFRGPRGLLGHVAGFLMSRKNAALNAWVVELLDVQSADRVLDIGCGPGLAVALAAARATNGFVAGVDASAVMVRQARWRNRSAVRAGRVELRLATAAALPYDAGHFTKVCAVNSLQFWPSVEAGLREVHRVLAPGGRVVMALRMRVENTNQFDRRRFGATDARIAEIVAAVERVGFRDVATQRRDVRGELHTAIGASR